MYYLFARCVPFVDKVEYDSLFLPVVSVYKEHGFDHLATG